MQPLRKLSSRPTLLVDERGRLVATDSSQVGLGVPGPFGRSRIVSALPVNGSGPMLQRRADRVLRDSDGHYLADPSGALIGTSGVWIARMLTARHTEDTRRL